MSEINVLILDVEREISLWLQEQILGLGLKAIIQPYREAHLIEDVGLSKASIVLISGDHTDNPNIAYSMINLHNIGIPAFHCGDLRQAEAVIHLLIKDPANRYLIGDKNTLDQESAKTLGKPFAAPSEFYRALVEDMPVMVTRTSSAGILTFVNQHFCDYFGLNAQDLIGKDFFSFFPEPERERLIYQYASFTIEDPVRTYELPFNGPDGQEHWLYWVERAIFDADGHNIGFQSMGQDITEQKQLRLRLEASEAQFRATVDHLAEGIALLNEIRDENGKIVDFHVEFMNSFGRKLFSNEFVGTKASEVVAYFAPGNDLLDRLIRSSQTGETLFLERLDLDPRIGGFTDPTSIEITVTSFSDKLIFGWRVITERVRAEEDLARSRDQIAALIASSGQMLEARDLDILLQTVKDQIAEVVPFDNTGVYFVENDTLQTAVYKNYYRYQETEAFANLMYKAVVLPELLKGDLQTNYVVIDDTHLNGSITKKLRAIVGEESPFLAENRSQLFVPMVYQNNIIGLIALVHSQPNIYTKNICMLVRAFANMVALGIQNYRLLQKSQTQAVMLERLRLARGLHDSVTQSLYSINLYTDAAKAALESKRIEKTAEYLKELHNLAMEATRELRMLIYDLRPVELEELGLAGAIRARLAAVETRSGFKTSFEVHGKGQLDPKVENELYQIAQEGLNNIAKHAAASQVNVLLEYFPEKFRLVIQDDGIGFDVSSPTKGVGLQTIHERIKLLGGTNKIISSPKKGTILTVEVKL